MLIALATVFILAYAAIALEHPLRINKSATALIAAGLLWTIYALGSGDFQQVTSNLHETLAQTAQIVFFLIGAMTIVEVIDAHNGFEVITSRIKTTKMSSLLWVVGCAAFFLSSVLDNLTTTIVMVSLMKKLLERREDRLIFAGVIVIAANAGGAWTPIGDVTTTMLWIGGRITTLNIMQGVFLPSVACLLCPLAILAFRFRGQTIIASNRAKQGSGHSVRPMHQILIFCMGIGALIAVPVFKEFTHLPPFMGILFALGILWVASDLLHCHEADSSSKEYISMFGALKRIDMSCIIFFLGILLAVATLGHTGILDDLARQLDHSIGRLDIIVGLIGVASAVVDNVPLVAASMGMYSMSVHPPDSFLWEFLAYCAGTGGSMLIIGSAAGVAAMGLEKIDFFWYARTIGVLAALGYVAGIAVYLLQYKLIGLLG